MEYYEEKKITFIVIYIDESQKHAEPKPRNKISHTLWLHFTETLEKTNLIYKWLKADQQLPGAKEWGRLKRGTNKPFWDYGPIHSLIATVVTQVYTSVKTHQAILLK